MENVSLAKAYEKYFKIGAAISPRDLTCHAGILKKHFNCITPENQMKYEPLNPDEGRWNFEPADLLVSFAKENGMAIRAHAPVWHAQTPDWIFDDDGQPADREKLIERMDEHTRAFASRYAASVQYWDVVNEAVDDYGENVLRRTRWLDGIGEDYLAVAFKLAKKYAPNVQLFYNDYNEANPVKREKILKLLRGLQEAEAPVEGFGLQSHINIYDYNGDDYRRAIEAYASLGLRLHITELDVSLFSMSQRKLPAPSITDEMLERQAQVYIDFFSILRKYSDYIDDVTTWGVADDITWLDGFPCPGRKNYPLMFYYDHTLKPFMNEIIGAALK